MRMTAPSVKVAYGLLPLLIKAASVRGAPSYGLMRVHNTDGRPALTGRARARAYFWRESSPTFLLASFGCVQTCKWPSTRPTWPHTSGVGDSDRPGFKTRARPPSCAPSVGSRRRCGDFTAGARIFAIWQNMTRAEANARPPWPSLELFRWHSLATAASGLRDRAPSGRG